MRHEKRLLISVIAIALAAAVALPAAQTLTDNQVRIARAVHKKIVMLPNYGVFDSISFAIDGNKVILRGEASRPTLKKSAERVVSRIEGVSAVQNEIKVLPYSRYDDRVRAEAYFRIYGNRTLNRYDPNRGTPMWITPARVVAGLTEDPPIGNHPIHIIVENGNITLEGVVDTTLDKQLVTIEANSVTGAFAVTNNLVVADGNNAD